MILFVVAHAALTIAFAFVCRGVGHLILRDDAPAATALGYGIIGQLLFALAAFGFLTRDNVMLLFAFAALASIPALRRIRITPLQLFVLLSSLPSLLISFYPPIGYDATMYHLVYARRFAEAGRLVFIDAVRFPVFPQLAEMHFTGALLLAGERGMQLTQWIALPVTALVTANLVRQAGGGERAALFAAALWLGTPYAVYLSGSGYIDVSLAMFVTLAIASRGAGVSGAFAGMAAATKYHGLFFIATLLRRRGFLLFVAMAALFAAPWYIHIARTTGNPLFPYLRGIFGDHEYRTRIDQSLMSVASDPRRAASFVPDELPFVTVVRRAIVGPIQRGIPPHSPVLVLLLPFAIAGAAIVPMLRKPLVAAFVYALIVSPLDWRFMIVIVPLLAVSVSIALERLIAARFTLAVALIFLMPGFAWGTLLIAVKYGPLPVTDVDRDAFLARRIPVYRAVRALGPATVYVLRAPQMAYYCPGKCLGDTHGPYRFPVIEPLLGDPPRLAEKLRAFGATHLVIDKTNSRFIPAPPFVRVYEDERAVGYSILPSL